MQYLEHITVHFEYEGINQDMVHNTSFFSVKKERFQISLGFAI